VPALQKQLLDIHAADGLQQKIDPRALPLGKSTSAVNLLKNKEGRLEKRLGFFQLDMSDPYGSGFQLSNGIKLATWNTNELLVVGRGTWAGTGARVTALQAQSDDLDGMLVRGQMPDVKVTADQIFANANLPATSTCCAGLDDYLVWAWIETGANNAIPFFGNVYWAATAKSTGDFVVPRSIMTAAPPQAEYLRLAVVGTTFVMCWSENAVNTSVIQCATMTLGALTTSGTWTSAHVGGIVTTNQADNNAFDMRAVTGETANFVLAYVTGARDNVNIVVDKRPAATANSLIAQWVAENVTNGDTISSLGVRADASGATNKIAVAYTEYNTSVNYAIRAATGNYPAMTTSKGPTTVYTSPTASRLEDSKPPYWMDITYGGNAGQTSAHPTWTVSWSPPGAIWVGWNKVSQSQVYRLSGTKSSPATIDASFDARIIQCQFFEGASNVTGWNNTSGTNALETPGVTLASRGIEENGIAYFLGWIPSSTQGSFVILAYDAAQNPEVVPGSEVPMRPVGMLQTRTALADSFPGGFTVPGPNFWTGGSEWATPLDVYGTSYVAYVGGTQGQRLQPAYGTVQMQPTTGYPATQWGTMAAFGGSLPIVYDGQNPVEQGFLYVPESIAVVITSNSNASGPFWNTVNDSYSWIFTWEWFDAQGNFHISARSTPVTITANDVVNAGFTLPARSQPTFYLPNLGVTLKQPPVAASLFSTLSVPPSAQVTLGAYRTGVSTNSFGLTYFRLTDRFFNNADPETLGGSPTLPQLTVNQYATTYLGPFEATFQDIVNDGVPGAAFGASPGITDGTHPLLYGDGTNGAPGSLDNFCPPATPVMVRHKERLFVARGNQVLYTKQRGELSGPGYNEQVNVFFVGGDDPITGMASMDDKLIILKKNQAYYVPGDGPADDGSGSSFLPPQPIPTDVGCPSPLGVTSTPEGVYYMSTAGLRRVSRSLAVEYVGAPVEDEFATYNTVCDAVLYPQANRLIFLANEKDSEHAGTGQFLGELVTRDYFLDAWTTGVVTDNATQTGFVSAAIALGDVPFDVPQQTLHLLGGDGRIWREHNPADANAYYDNATYVSWTWTSPWIRPPGDSNNPGTGMQGRFRAWDMNVFGVSETPHGLIFQVAIDYGTLGNNRTWVWNQANVPSIAPGGSTLTPLTQLRTYDGRMGEAFQFQIQDVSDPASTNGQGFQLLGMTVSVGTYKGPYGLPGASTQ